MAVNKVGTVEFGVFTEAEKVNPYADIIPQMIEQGENASVTITVKGTDIIRERNLFAKAANAHDKTARLRLTDDSAVEYGDDEKGKRKALGGVAKLTFTLTARHKVRRGKAAQ